MTASSFSPARESPRRAGLLPSGVREGLWNGYRVDQVATPEAWHADPELVWRFYSMRRRDALAAEPNAAHLALAKLKQKLGNHFYLCTQNVDDLHERAGSHRVHHMHGSLFRVALRCHATCLLPIRSSTRRGKLPACREVRTRRSARTLCGSAKFPWTWKAFIANSIAQLSLLVVGTSGSVYPAAGFVHIANQRGIRAVYVGPEEPLNCRRLRRDRSGTGHSGASADSLARRPSYAAAPPLHFDPGLVFAAGLAEAIGSISCFRNLGLLINPHDRRGEDECALLNPWWPNTLPTNKFPARNA